MNLLSLTFMLQGNMICRPHMTVGTSWLLGSQTCAIIKSEALSDCACVTQGMVTDKQGGSGRRSQSYATGTVTQAEGQDQEVPESAYIPRSNGGHP